jgi:hypothetical protein
MSKQAPQLAGYVLPANPVNCRSNSSGIVRRQARLDGGRAGFLLLAGRDTPIMRVDCVDAGWQLSKVIVMSNPGDEELDEAFGKVPMGHLDVETEAGDLHVDTFDREAGERFMAERAQRAEEATAKPRSSQNRQHSG